MIFNILAIAMNTLIGVYLLATILFELRKWKFQKIWDKEKQMRLKVKPQISNAELCEQYVMFCKRTDCKVEF